MRNLKASPVGEQSNAQRTRIAERGAGHPDRARLGHHFGAAESVRSDATRSPLGSGVAPRSAPAACRGSLGRSSVQPSGLPTDLATVFWERNPNRGLPQVESLQSSASHARPGFRLAASIASRPPSPDGAPGSLADSSRWNLSAWRCLRSFRAPDGAAPSRPVLLKKDRRGGSPLSTNEPYGCRLPRVSKCPIAMGLPGTAGRKVYVRSGSGMNAPPCHCEPQRPDPLPSRSAKSGPTHPLMGEAGRFPVRPPPPAPHHCQRRPSWRNLWSTTRCSTCRARESPLNGLAT